MSTADECKLPLSGDARPVVISSSGWPTVSSHDITESSGITSVVDMEIEPGSEPLYILASSDATIWRVSGARERVAAFILADNSGVAGLSANVVHAFPRTCMPNFMHSYKAAVHLIRFEDKETITADQLIALARDVLNRVLTRRFGVAPLLIDEARPLPNSPRSFREGTITSISIPSGARTADMSLPGARIMSGVGDAGTLWWRFMASHPGGVVDIDPSTVITTKPLERYEVLPMEGGFAQLIERGAIEPIGWRNAVKLADGSIVIGRNGQNEDCFRIPFVFLVKAPIRMPFHPAIFSMSDPRLVLAPGVPMPEGDLEGVCIKRGPIDEAERVRLERGGRC